MTLLELSAEYRAHAKALETRIALLQAQTEQIWDERERLLMMERIKMLSTMLREARELAVLTEHYYDRRYRRNVRYTI